MCRIGPAQLAAKLWLLQRRQDLSQSPRIARKFTISKPVPPEMLTLEALSFV